MSRARDLAANFTALDALASDATALGALDEGLRDLPGDDCRVIADCDLYCSGAAVSEWLVYTAPDVGPGIITTARLDPEPAGRNYPWRAVSLP